MLTEKYCPKCTTTKPILEFGFQKCRNRPQSWCKLCHSLNRVQRKKNQERYALDMTRIKEWKLANPDKVKNTILKRDYGITLDHFNRLSEEQGHVCAICKKPETVVIKSGFRHLAVDHCHQTDKIRGLLCGNCNRAIGYLQDDPSLLKAAMEYLLKHEAAPI